MNESVKFSTSMIFKYYSKQRHHGILASNTGSMQHDFIIIIIIYIKPDQSFAAFTEFLKHPAQ